ncbi:MAG: YbjQ family protein [Thermofilaceae archaeon]
MLLSTTHTLPGYKIVRNLGIVTGISIRTRGMLGRFIAGIEAMVGGRSESYIAELKKAREEAIQDMVAAASRLGANAIIGIDFETSEVLEGFIMITATGTAVVAEPETRSA